jgi:hypothetical protein
MNRSMRIPVGMLGQSGCRLAFAPATVYLDPYLSNSVQELDAPDLARQVPIACQPDDVTDADWVLITHEHIDHCDPHTLPKLAKASPQARFVGPVAGRCPPHQLGRCRRTNHRRQRKLARLGTGSPRSRGSRRPSRSHARSGKATSTVSDISSITPANGFILPATLQPARRSSTR